MKASEQCIMLATVRDDEFQALKTVLQKHVLGGGDTLEYLHDHSVYVGKFISGRGTTRLLVGRFRDTGNIIAASETGHFVNECINLFGSKPLYAVLVGICAGARERKNLHLGDVVVPQNIFDVSVQLVDGKGTEPEIRVPGSPLPALIRLCHGVAENDPWRDFIVEPPPTDLRAPAEIYIDALFTGQEFLAGGERFLKLRQEVNRKGIAYEMESGGFGGECNTRSVPYLVIRGVSDFADSLAPLDTYRTYAASTAAALAAAVVRQAMIPKT